MQHLWRHLLSMQLLWWIAVCPGKGGYMTGGGERKCRKEQLLVPGRVSSSAFQPSLCCGRKHMQIVANAPKEALLMEKG